MKTQADLIVEQSGIVGLTSIEVEQSRTANGRNEITSGRSPVIEIIADLVKEPMLILLVVASIIYFITGNTSEGFFMVAAIIIVTGISLFQESRSKKALAKLRLLTQPLCRVIRDNKISTVPREDLVIGDYIIIEEGSAVPADGTIIQSNDFTVNESILTGESLPVQKDSNHDNKVFQGTLVASGLAICSVTAIGIHTALGNIGRTLEGIKKETTPLQKQIGNFVKKMALFGLVIFLIVWAINFLQSRNLLDSLLKALTLAMSILPEEIPVAFTTFMALGAWRLMKYGVVVKNTSTVETLGSASIICLDKTGTITENRMQLTKIYSLETGMISDTIAHQNNADVITAAMWASEPIPFDPMEVALHEAYQQISTNDERSAFRMIHEYPLGGQPPMMTHVFENEGGTRIIAAKGAPEALIKGSDLYPEQIQLIEKALGALTNDGYRVLGVGVSQFADDSFPEKQQDLRFKFLGLVAFYDPPKQNITEVLRSFYNAGIQVKIITGDNAATTSTIARQIQFTGYEKAISGHDLMQFSDEVLKQKVMEYNVFTRMFPDAKLRIVNALKANDEVVAMTGDGVNDGPALKAAHISIAMGKKGSEIAKEVSSIVLTDDDLARMVDAIAMGRKIYSNLKKAIQYIISIHIPIILTVFIPLALRWAYPAIFTPVHVIFLELIMGPTCSIIYENEPIEKNTMIQKPRPLTSTFFSLGELGISIIQGLVITAGVLLIYQYALKNFNSEPITRTMVFTTLITANIFLTLVNRSFTYSIFTTIRYNNNMIAWIISLTVLLTACFIFLPAPAAFFNLVPLTLNQLAVSILAGASSVLWFEIAKLYKRKQSDLSYVRG